MDTDDEDRKAKIQKDFANRDSLARSTDSSPLDRALYRAKRAENLLIAWKYEQDVQEVSSLIKQKEEEASRKLMLYTSPEQKDSVTKEFQLALGDLELRKTFAQNLKDACTSAINCGVATYEDLLENGYPNLDSINLYLSNRNNSNAVRVTFGNIDADNGAFDAPVSRTAVLPVRMESVVSNGPLKIDSKPADIVVKPADMELNSTVVKAAQDQISFGFDVTEKMNWADISEQAEDTPPSDDYLLSDSAVLQVGTREDLDNLVLDDDSFGQAELEALKSFSNSSDKEELDQKKDSTAAVSALSKKKDSTAAVSALSKKLEPTKVIPSSPRTSPKASRESHAPHAVKVANTDDERATANPDKSASVSVKSKTAAASKEVEKKQSVRKKTPPLPIDTDVEGENREQLKKMEPIHSTTETKTAMVSVTPSKIAVTNETEKPAAIDWAESPYKDICDNLADDRSVCRTDAIEALVAAVQSYIGPSDAENFKEKLKGIDWSDVFIRARAATKKFAKKAKAKSAKKLESEMPKPVPVAVPTVAYAQAASPSKNSKVADESSAGKPAPICVPNWPNKSKQPTAVKPAVAANKTENREISKPLVSESTGYAHNGTGVRYYKADMCRFYVSQNGMCTRGSACIYAHGKHELRTDKILAPRKLTENPVINAKRLREVDRKAFIGALAHHTDNDSFKTYFKKFGELTDCVVMFDRETGRAKGFGFVTYAKPESLDAMIAKCPHFLDGQKIDAKRASLKDEDSQKGYARIVGFQPKLQNESKPSGVSKPLQPANHAKEKAVVIKTMTKTKAGSPAKAWTSKKGNDPNSTDAMSNECVVCMEQLTKRKALACGHNQFHAGCIDKWLDQKNATCPLCRKLAHSGMKAAEFPSLHSLN